ncbi:unnamed protein product [Trichobilharzia regenti]|uniref:G_PROTEIN_RECEP_F1_2 domain-containing protein n=1 Tax=Trichobilharzia regenti TaxID=157069 RepID=A0A183W9G4_TRIRE|nr:unnamed protein product [Trichobilharzia regenti]VDQ04647.1 unnamed protein product [Trichobilharzia regenti]
MPFNISTYPFFDNPWDFFIICENVKRGSPKSSQVLCMLATLEGILCAYFLIPIVLFNVVCNVINAVIFLHGYQQKTRQVVYLGVLALIDPCACLVEATLRLIPARGFPYASNGAIFFSINNTSRIGCKLYRSISSFIIILKGNILVITMLDKLLAIQFPLKFGKLTRRHAWYFVIINFGAAILMTIPIVILSDWTVFHKRIVCYERPSNLFLSLYYCLFSKACVIQTAINGILNGALLVKIYVWLRHRRKIAILSTPITKLSELSACIVLLIISGTTFLLTIPEVLVNIFAVSVPFASDQNGVYIKLRVVLHLRDVFSIFIYMQSIFNTMIFIWRMKHFRQLFLCIFQCNPFQ